jgi:hypothetical protein
MAFLNAECIILAVKINTFEQHSVNISLQYTEDASKTGIRRHELTKINNPNAEHHIGNKNNRNPVFHRIKSSDPTFVKFYFAETGKPETFSNIFNSSNKIL